MKPAATRAAWAIIQEVGPRLGIEDVIVFPPQRECALVRIAWLTRIDRGGSEMTYRVTLIPGDGVGPELSEATRRVLEATGVAFDWDVQDAGADVMDRYGTPLPEHVLDSIRSNKVAIKGPITTPVGGGFRSVNVALRKELDLYCCLRPCKSYKGVRSRYQDVDIVICRENMEDLYAGNEFEMGKPETLKLIEVLELLSHRKILEDSGISIKPISVEGTKRIVRFAV